MYFSSCCVAEMFLFRPLTAFKSRRTPPPNRPPAPSFPLFLPICIFTLCHPWTWVVVDVYASSRMRTTTHLSSVSCPTSSKSQRTLLPVSHFNTFGGYCFVARIHSLGPKTTAALKHSKQLQTLCGTYSHLLLELSQYVHIQQIASLSWGFVCLFVFFVLF